MMKIWKDNHYETIYSLEDIQEMNRKSVMLFDKIKERLTERHIYGIESMMTNTKQYVGQKYTDPYESYFITREPMFD